MPRKRKRKSGSSRNSPCPCGSGQKFKHCCENPKQLDIETAYQQAFIYIPDSIETYLFDTNVWGELAQDSTLQDEFLAHNKADNYLAGLTVYSLFELSRAENLLDKLDAFFLRARHHIWLASLYNELQDEELVDYPKSPRIQWMTISNLTDDSQPNLISKFSKDKTFTTTRDDHLRFGLSRFMSLEQFKQNYPPSPSGKYSADQALDFGQKNAVDFLRRIAPSFLKRLRNDGVQFNSKLLLSIQIRSLFAFYKYYIYGQVPGASDFMDFAAISFTPFVDNYVTEKNVMNALKHIKSNQLGLPNTEIVHINDFVSDLRTWREKSG